MICPQYQRENLGDSIFCEHCGMRLEAICSHYGEPNRREAKLANLRLIQSNEWLTQNRSKPKFPKLNHYEKKAHAVFSRLKLLISSIS